MEPVTNTFQQYDILAIKRDVEINGLNKVQRKAVRAFLNTPHLPDSNSIGPLRYLEFKASSHKHLAKRIRAYLNHELSCWKVLPSDIRYQILKFIQWDDLRKAKLRPCDYPFFVEWLNASPRNPEHCFCNQKSIQQQFIRTNGEKIRSTIISCNSDFDEWLDHTTNLVKLHVYNCMNSPLEPYQNPFWKLKQLTKLKMDEVRLSRNHLKAIVNITSLTSLNLKNSVLTFESVKSICEHLVNLRQLNLHGNKICNSGAKEISRLTNLKKLSLGNNLIDAKGARAISKKIPLEFLAFHWTAFGDKRIRHFVHHLPSINRVILSNCHLNDRDVKHLAKNLTYLKELAVGGNSITDKGVSHICSYLTNLKQLDLSYTKINHLNPIFGALPSLQHLDVSSTISIVDPCIPDNVSHGATNLRTLSVAYCNLGPLYIHSIKNLTNLTRLNLAGNGLKNAFKDVLEHCTFIKKVELDAFLDEDSQATLKAKFRQDGIWTWRRIQL